MKVQYSSREVACSVRIPKTADKGRHRLVRMKQRFRSSLAIRQNLVLLLTWPNVIK
jgi:hypothetical protein